MSNKNIAKEGEKYRFPAGDAHPRLGGRPFGKKNKSTIVRQMIDGELTTTNPLTEKVEPESIEVLMIAAQIKKAIANGDTYAFNVIMDFAYPNKNTLTGDSDNDNRGDSECDYSRLTIEERNTLIRLTYKAQGRDENGILIRPIEDATIISETKNNVLGG